MPNLSLKPIGILLLASLILQTPQTLAQNPPQPGPQAPPQSDDYQEVYEEPPPEPGMEDEDEGKEENEEELTGSESETPTEPKAETPATEPQDEAASAEADREPMPLIKRKRGQVKYYENKPESQFIEHPNASKGLVKITKEKTYIYKVRTSGQSRAASFRLGFYSPTNLANPDNGNTFDQNYGDSNNPMLLIDYEWQFTRALGRMGFKVGSGFFIANGSGQFANPDLQSDATSLPKEGFTFLVFPATAGLMYRFQFWDTQIIVPYAEGGGMGFVFAELRDDDKPPKGGGALGAYAAGGAAFRLNFLDPISMLNLDREYGINNVYLLAEYRRIFGTPNRFDFSANCINVGFLADF